MMTWKIRYTDKARRDLRNIMEYVSYNLLEPETASHPAAFLTRWRGGWFLFRCFYQASFLIERDPIAEDRVIVILKLFGILPVFDLLQSLCTALL